MKRSAPNGAAMCLGLLLPALAAAQATPPASATIPGFKRTETVDAVLTVDGKSREVKLIGRTEEGEVVLSDGGTSRKLDARVIEAAFFRIELDQYAVYQATRARKWVTAMNALLRAVQPTLAYLDLPQNNTADLVLQAGDCAMKLARETMSAAKTDEERQSAEDQYKTAYSLFQYATAAAWYSGGQIAELRRIQCLLALAKPRTAQEFLNRVEKPMPGDAAYGLYWLATAQLALGRQEYAAAMDAAVNSVCFENKSMDTFPDALLISARCYEELQNWYRARDVYYEIARIFPLTEWADAARARLAFIMDQGLTRQKEKMLVEDVFFGLEEDMNELSDKLLASKPTDIFADEKVSLPQPRPQPREKTVDLDEKETAVAPPDAGETKQ
ncbi:MAG: hypothetical protein FJ225_06140 [Lentisphaerae bacterium]|nr:hypothetical protein [Lentisphaerota bacterium]